MGSPMFPWLGTALVIATLARWAASRPRSRAQTRAIAALITKTPIEHAVRRAIAPPSSWMLERPVKTSAGVNR